MRWSSSRDRALSKVRPQPRQVMPCLAMGTATICSRFIDGGLALRLSGFSVGAAVSPSSVRTSGPATLPFACRFPRSKITASYGAMICLCVIAVKPTALIVLSEMPFQGVGFPGAAISVAVGFAARRHATLKRSFVVVMRSSRPGSGRGR